VHNGPSTLNPARRHDIDWLRVILFGLLIPFHVAIGVYWSTYGTEVNPNLNDDQQRSDQIEEANDYTAESVDLTSMMLHWMHQWRLAALFMISGMGTAFAFRRRSWKQFSIERCKRLLVPMFFGVWTVGFLGSVILEPNIYKGTGIFEIGKEFALHVIFTSLLFWVPIIGKFALGHLWFLWNLALYSLLLIPLFHVVQQTPEGRIVKVLRGMYSIKGGLGVLLLFPILLSLIEILLKPWIIGFLGSGYEWLWYLGFFAVGYACIVAKKEYYSFIEQRRSFITGTTILLTVAFVWLRLQQHADGIAYVDGGWIEQGLLHNPMTLLGCFIHSFHAWFWCLTVFSWGAYFLNKPSPYLAYLNQGVYPFYIVHMPITFAGLSLAGHLGLTHIPAVLFSCVVVTIGCWILFELLRRTGVTRFLFGIKPLPKP